MDQPIKISPVLESAINNLLLRDTAIIEAGKIVLSEDFFIPDIFVSAVLNRTLQLLHGFVTLVQNKNYLSATPLYRLQLDNGLRLWAAHLVESFDVFTSEVLNGKRIDKMKSKHGDRLTDHHLISSLAEYLQLPKLPTAYNYASGFVHLSGQHIFATHRIKPKGVLSSRIVRFDETIPEAKWLDLIEGFSFATDLVLNLINAWANHKGRERLSKEKA